MIDTIMQYAKGVVREYGKENEDRNEKLLIDFLY